MRRYSFIVMISFFIGAAILIPNLAQAISLTPVTDLSDWNQYQEKPNNPVSLTVNDGSVAFVADGTLDYAWGTLVKSYPGSIGVVAKVNVSTASGNCELGIRKWVGKTDSGNVLSAEIYLVRWSGDYEIDYYLRERDSSGTYRQLAAGSFGKWDSPAEWSPGEDKYLGLALVGDEVWFYTPNYGILAKLQILTPFTPSDDPIFLVGYAASGADNHIEGVIKDVSIVFP